MRVILILLVLAIAIRLVDQRSVRHENVSGTQAGNAQELREWPAEISKP